MLRLRLRLRLMLMFMCQKMFYQESCVRYSVYTD
jgi:hypothetical protein